MGIPLADLYGGDCPGPHSYSDNNMYGLYIARRCQRVQNHQEKLSYNLVAYLVRNCKIFKMGAATVVEILIAILLPPLGVFLKFGCSVNFLFTLTTSVEFWICLILTLLGYIPGIIYAVYAITRE
ncbi:hypothetical protein YC2023_029747 [Brassica napus]